MKTATDPRHLDRINVMQEIFAWEFSSKNSPVNKKSQKIIEKVKKIDEYIKEAAPMWPLEKINKMDLAILRQAIFELLIEKSTPPKVIVDEAVEIAKKYGSESSPSFVNGALGKLISQNDKFQP